MPIKVICWLSSSHHHLCVWHASPHRAHRLKIWYCIMFNYSGNQIAVIFAGPALNIDHTNLPGRRSNLTHLGNQNKVDFFGPNPQETDQQPENPPSQSIDGDSTSLCTEHEIFNTVTDQRIWPVSTFWGVFCLDSHCFHQINDGTSCFHVSLSPVLSYKLHFPEIIQEK